jgi:hypothetical protein
MSATDIKPYTKKQLALLYEVSIRCFTTMLIPFTKEIGDKEGWYYSVKQVTIIFEKLGYPNSFLGDEL